MKDGRHVVELRRKLIQMQRKFASCDDRLFLQVSTQQTITCHGLGGNFFSAIGGSFLGANQQRAYTTPVGGEWFFSAYMSEKKDADPHLTCFI